MARNVKHSGKPDGSAAIKSGEPFGTTFQRSTTHAPELRKGVQTGKTTGKIAPNGIMCGPTGGDTFTVNRPAVNFPSASPRPRKGADGDATGKTIDSRQTGAFEPPDTVDRQATGHAGTRTYDLKGSYDKKGRTDSKRAR